MMMQAGSALLSSLLGLPSFLLYMAVAAALVALFVYVYTRITPYDEIALIREGNWTASISLSGSIIGFVIPLAKAIAQATSIPDMLVWGFAAFVIQLLAYVLARIMLPGLGEKIKSNTAAAGTLLAGISIASGMLNAAAMSL
jgi:putative membrane protein